MKMDFTAKDLQRRIEEVKNDNDPDPILYEKIKSYDNSEARRHINLPSVLSETKKTITDLVLRNYCFGEDFSISSLSRSKIKKKSFKAKQSSSVLQHHQAKFSVIKMSERDNNNDEDYR